MVVTLHFAHCVQAPARQELWSAHIDLGPQTLTLFSYLSSPLSSLLCHFRNGMFRVPLKRVTLLSGLICPVVWAVRDNASHPRAAKMPLNNPGLLRPWSDCPASCWNAIRRKRGPASHAIFGTVSLDPAGSHNSS